MKYIKEILNFKGKAARKELFSYYIVAIIGLFIIGILKPLPDLYFYVYILYFLIMLLSLAAVTVRRLIWLH